MKILIIVGNVPQHIVARFHRSATCRIVQFQLHTYSRHVQAMPVHQLNAHGSTGGAHMHGLTAIIPTPDTYSRNVTCAGETCTLTECCTVPPVEGTTCTDLTAVIVPTPFTTPGASCADETCTPTECCTVPPVAGTTCTGFDCSNHPNSISLTPGDVTCAGETSAETECCTVPLLMSVTCGGNFDFNLCSFYQSSTITGKTM